MKTNEKIISDSGLVSCQDAALTFDTVHPRYGRMSWCSPKSRIFFKQAYRRHRVPEPLIFYWPAKCYDKQDSGGSGMFNSGCMVSCPFIFFLKLICCVVIETAYAKAGHCNLHFHDQLAVKFRVPSLLVLD